MSEKIEILDYPHPSLKKKGRKVENPLDPEVQSVIQAMFEKLYATPDCAGLAATQLSFSDPLAITVIDLSKDQSEPLCLINPVIVERSGETYEPEGCMSVYPDYVHKPVKRASEVTVRALNQKGEPMELKATGFLAKCIQHEVDHLNGMLYIDHLSVLKRKIVESQITKARKSRARRDPD